MITSLLRVILPQVLVAWIPTLTGLAFGFIMALTVVANFGKVSTATAAALILVFALVMFLVDDVFGDTIIKRLTKSDTREDFFLKLREKHKANLSMRANKVACSIFHVLFFLVVAFGMFLLDRAVGCCS